MSHARTLDGRRCEPLISEASCGAFQANLRSCIMAEPTRPPSIPASARYCADNAANFRWVDGPVDADGKPHGMTRTYSDDGLLHAEADHVNGTPEGLNTVFHPDGSVASTGEWRNGKMYDAVFFRAKGPSTEPFPGDVGPAVISVRYCSLDGTANDRILYFDGAGQEVTDTGEPMPPRPASVDAEASWFPRRARWLRGGVLRGAKPARVGTCKQWTANGVLEEHEAYDAAGQRLLHEKFFDDGTVERRKVYEAGICRIAERYRAPGVLRSRTITDEEDRDVHTVAYDAKGIIEKEETWRYEGDVLMHHIEREAGGVLLFEATRVGDVTTAQLYAAGRREAEGTIVANALTGQWRVFDQAGAVRFEFDATPLAVTTKLAYSSVWQALQTALFRTVEPTLGPIAELAGCTEVAWATLETCYGKAVGFASLLRGLTASEPMVQSFALNKIMMQIEHQGSVYPATAAVVPFLIRLLVHPNVDRMAVLGMVLAVGRAAAPYRAEAERSLVDNPVTESDDWRLAVLGTVDAIGAEWDILAKLLEVDDAKLQGVIVALAGLARGRDLSKQLLQLALEATSPTLRAIAIDALCEPTLPTLVASLAPCLADADPLVRMSAAIALGCRWGVAAPTGTDTQLAEALAKLDELGPAYYQLPFVDVRPLAYVALAAGSMRTPACVAMAPTIVDGLAGCDGVTAIEVGRGLLALALGTGTLSPIASFVDVLDSLARSERFFAFNVNAAEVLRDFGLPTQAEALATLVATLRQASDPAAALQATMAEAEADDDDVDEDED